MMSTTLAPKLTRLDERVLRVLDDGPCRASTVAAALFGKAAWKCEACGHIRSDTRYLSTPRGWPQRDGRTPCLECLPADGRIWDAAMSRPILIASPQDTQTVREVLRGLECLGHVTVAGGWWRRA